MPKTNFESQSSALSRATRGAIVVSLLAASTFFAPARAAGYRVFVTNELSGDVSVIDGATETVIATIPVGKRPRGLKADPSGSYLYVALSGSPILPPGADEANAPPADKAADGVGVVDAKRFKLLRVIKGISDPEQLAVTRDGKRLYVASEDTGKLHAIDIATEKITANLSVGREPEGVTLSPNGRVVCATSEGDSIASLIDTATNSIAAQVRVGTRPRFCAFSADGSRAFVSAEADSTVSIIDTRRSSVIHTLHIDGENIRPMGIAIAPNRNSIYLASGRGGTLIDIDTTTNKVSRSIVVGARPWNVAISSDGKRIYTANGPSNDVGVVDGKTFTVDKRISVGNRPWGVIVVESH